VQERIVLNINLTKFYNNLFLFYTSCILLLVPQCVPLKVPKCEIFDPFFFTPINPIWVGDLRTGEKNIFLKTTADIRHFVFLRRLSLR
jgi:hypothetical protein